MFSRGKILDGSTYLGHHLVANDYYCEGEFVSGKWVGKGAERLNLAELKIKNGDETFEAFRNNRLPDGNKLTPRDGHGRVRFHDFQCSAQKSVSVMAITMGDYRLVEAHRDAVSIAYGELEGFAACQANTREERRNRITGELIAARFEHTASRALDAQLHTHLVTVNATYDSETKRWVALTEEEIFRAIRFAGKVYQNELAKSCRRLGYEIRDALDSESRITGFEIEGVSEEILKRFSKRREQIEKEIDRFKKEKGREPTTAEIHIITTATRDRKLKEISTPQVIRAQRAQLSVDEVERLEAIKSSAMLRARSGMEIKAWGVEKSAIRHSITHTFERECVAKGHELLAEALNQKLGHIDLAQLRKSFAAEGMTRLTEMDANDLRDLFTTRSEMQREKWIQVVARESLGKFPPFADAAFVSKKLSPEQAGAAQRILECRDRFAIFRGAAGVGKTTTLTELDRILAVENRNVTYFAPTASATMKLKEEGFGNADTVASLIAAGDKSPVKRGSVVICDEAGMLSNKDGQELMRLALKNNWRVVFVGDVRQHTAVDAGDFLRLLESTPGLHRAELVAIRRQSCEAYRKAIALMADGRPKEGLLALNALGRIGNSGAEYLTNAAKEYVDASRNAANHTVVLCVAPTWEEIDALQSCIRGQLKSEGRIRDCNTFTINESLGWTAAEKSEARRYRVGMSVAFNRKCGPFRNGETGKVIAVEGNQIRVETSDGRNRALPLNKGSHDVCMPKEIEVGSGDLIMLRANDRARKLVNGTLLRIASIDGSKVTTVEGVNFDAKDYTRFSHGYATTSHKSQGMTCDRVIVAAARLDAKAAYVACSRGKTLCSIHTPDFERLISSLPDGDRDLAVEFAQSSPKWPDQPVNTPSKAVLKVFESPAWAGVLGPLPIPPSHVTKPTLHHEHQQHSL